MRLSASQLSSFDRCPTQYRFEKIDKLSGAALSRTLFGTVVHHALHAFERHIAARRDEIGVDAAVAEALEIALATFDYFWHANHIEELCETRVTEWIMRDSYGSLRQLGLDSLKKYASLWALDDHVLLALEHPFEVAIPGSLDRLTGEPHTISGFVDRLVLRKKRSQWILDNDDWKTGKRKYGLRHHLGLTVYCFATTQRPFWEPFAELGYDPDEMFAAYQDLPRHANWYDLQGFDLCDAGYRGPQDYVRLAKAVDQQALSVQAGIFPLRISGDTCTYCAFKDLCPDGTGLPADTHGSETR